MKGSKRNPYGRASSGEVDEKHYIVVLIAMVEDSSDNVGGYCDVVTMQKKKNSKQK